MAGKPWDQTHALDLRFLENPVGLSFYQAVRRLECLFAHKPRIGYAKRSPDDPVQLCQEPSLRFAPATLQRFERRKNDGKPRLMVNFMGLLGPQGPMPLNITDYVHDRELNHDDPTLARFLDIFNHRMICLFYRAWACNRQTISYDRPHEDRFSAYIGSLIGIGTDSLRDRDAVPDMAKLHYSGHLACQTRHAEGLRTILEDYFGVKTSIEEFVGQWINVPDAYQCRLGQCPDNATVGVNVVIGSRVWDCQKKFRIRMGPLALKDYERMLPAGESFAGLKAWVRNYVGDELSWELQLILKASEVPALRLGEAGRLGWTTWLKSRPFEEDVGDLLVDADAA
jgi:type VI secretion system protein ImpH